MKYPFVLTFVFISLVLKMAPVSAGESEEAVHMKGFEVNHFKMPAALKLLAKSRMFPKIFNDKNQYKICLVINVKFFGCGESFGPDQYGRVCRLTESKNFAGHINKVINIGKAFDVDILQKGEHSVVQITGGIAKKLFYILDDLYIDNTRLIFTAKSEKKVLISPV
ncbi:MAG: hypothetical protein HN576_05205 [Bacteriovoracaceae bacterium]|jgi:hypothetical protein|nr:hypothetical protein [Bacteriovoracaceae bacterium]